MRNTATEQFLSWCGAKWKFERIPTKSCRGQLGLVRPGATLSKSNLAAIDFKLDALVKLGQPEELEPIIVIPRGNKKYDIDDGHHRCDRYLARGIQTIEAYILQDVSDETGQKVAATANMWLIGEDVHGEEQSLALCIKAIEAGMPREVAVKLYNRPKAEVNRFFRVKASREALKKAGFRKSLSTGQLDTLSKLKHRTLALEIGAGLAADLNLHHDLLPICTRLYNAADDAEIHTIAAQVRKLGVPLRGPRGTNTVLTKIKDGMTRLYNVHADTKKLQTTFRKMKPSERTALCEEIDRVVEILHEIKKYL